MGEDSSLITTPFPGEKQNHEFDSWDYVPPASLEIVFHTKCLPSDFKIIPYQGILFYDIVLLIETTACLVRAV